MNRFTRLLPLALALFMAVPAMSQPETGKSLLGTPTRLVLSCKNVVTSLTWWTRLGFLPVAENPGSADSAITLTDGQLNITLTKEVLPSPIVMFRSESIKDLKDTLDALEVPTTHDVEGPTYREIRLLSPNGIHVAVRSASAESYVPVSGDSNRLCGKNTELSIGRSRLPCRH